MVVRKACYEAAGPFDPELRICEDSHMWLRLSRRFRLVGMPQPLVRIRVHSGNTMGNAARFCQYRLLYVHKLFGPLAALPAGQENDGRMAYAYGYRACAFAYLQAGGENEAWHELIQAGRLLPAIWDEVELYYELLCGRQPRGRRGDAAVIDVPARLAAVRRRLKRLDGGQRRCAYGNLYLAGAMVSDKAGEWRRARGYLLRALFWQPRLLGRPLVLRRLIKLVLGKRMSRLLKAQLVRPGNGDPDAIAVSVKPLSTL
jgi:hypothetical protein